MPGEKKLIGVYGQMVEGGEEHGLVTEFKAALVKKAVVKGYTLKSDVSRDDVFAVKGTEEDKIEVEIYKFGPRGTASLNDRADEEELTLIDVIATGTNADGSTFSDNISIYADVGKTDNEELVSKVDDLETKLAEASELLSEIQDILADAN